MGSCDTSHPPEKPLLQQILDLPLVGEYMAVGVAAVPLLGLLVGRGVVGLSGETGGWFGVAASSLTWAWLVFLQRRLGVKLRLPVFRIPLWWLMPVYLAVSVIELLS